MKRNNNESLGNILKQWLENQPFSNKIYSAKIKEIWLLKMGTTINSYTTSLILNKSTLIIQLTSSVIRHELSMNKEKIKSMLNEEIGKEIIKEVVIQ